MAGSGFERLFDDLDVGLEAAIAREEEEAADDLARALQQDTPFHVAVSRTGWNVRLPGGETALVEEVGTDYIAASLGQTSILAPLERVALSASEDVPRPRMSGRALVEVLRRLAREGIAFEVASDQGSFSGRLSRTAADHLGVASPTGETLIGMRSVVSLRFEQLSPPSLRGD